MVPYVSAKERKQKRKKVKTTFPDQILQYQEHNQDRLDHTQLSSDEPFRLYSAFIIDNVQY